MYCFVVVSVLCQSLGVRMFCNCSCVETFSLSPVHDLTDMSLFDFIFFYCLRISVFQAVDLM